MKWILSPFCRYSAQSILISCQALSSFQTNFTRKFKEYAPLLLQGLWNLLESKPDLFLNLADVRDIRTLLSNAILCSLETTKLWKIIDNCLRHFRTKQITAEVLALSSLNPLPLISHNLPSLSSVTEIVHRVKIICPFVWEKWAS